MVLATEQARHDAINLSRLIRRLEKSVADEDWEGTAQNELWMKSLATLQTVKFARKLLKNVELAGISPQDEKRYNGVRANLDKFETFLKSVEEHSTPKPTQPTSYLSSVPIPAPPSREVEPPPELELVEQDVSTDNLLTSPSEPPLPSSSFASPIPILIPPTIPIASKSTSVATGAFLDNSRARHEAMSEQLAQMAEQLKKNAQHFSESLAKDKAVVEETHEKLESNFGVMQKERIRLRDHRGKSGSTTCLVIFAVLAVTAIFIFMVALIRIT